MTDLLVIAGETGAVVSAGRIALLGKAATLRRPGLAVADHGPGAILAPRHHHPFHTNGYAAAVAGLSVKEAHDFADLGQRVAEAGAAMRPGEALVVNRLDDDSLAEGRLPTRLDLDRMVSDRPVLLYRYCGHVAVANSAALALAGLDDHPTGILAEAAIHPVAAAVGRRQPPLDPENVHRALAGLPGLGLGRLTAIVSTGEPVWCGVADEIATLIEVGAGLPLDLDVLVIATDPPDLLEAAARLENAASNIHFLGWKEFADGSFGGRTAALYEPYADDPTTCGVLRLDPERARVMAEASLKLGGTVAVHAIGDLANDRVLDLFEGLVGAGADPTRLRIEHASLLTPAAIGRMARLGVTASVQPAFMLSETEWLPRRLGARAQQAYPLAQLLAAGVALVGGSDCPVEPPSPWIGVAAARGSAGLDAGSALGLFGTPLRSGDSAHLLVVDRDPASEEASPGDAAATKVTAVYRAGLAVPLVGELPFR